MVFFKTAYNTFTSALHHKDGLTVVSLFFEVEKIKILSDPHCLFTILNMSYFLLLYRLAIEITRPTPS